MASTRTTPGRRRHNNVKENIYFEPGKQGRRTGITLKDTGIRDEFGLEPVSGIFSSPVASPQQSTARNGPDPEIAEPLSLRKTPRLPPKTQTPRHTNIGGSPVRHSSVRPGSRHTSPTRPLTAQRDRANRKLDFSRNTDPVAASIEQSPSPFKPRPGRTRKSIFNFDDSPVKRVQPARSDSAELERTVQEAQDAVDQLVGQATNGVADQEEFVPPPDELELQDHGLDQMDVEDASVQVRSAENPRPVSSNLSSNQKRKREQRQTIGAFTKDSPSKSLLEPESKRRKSYASKTEVFDQADPNATEVTFADATDVTDNEPETTHIERTVADATEYTMVEQTEYTVADPTEHTNAEVTEYTEQSIEESALEDDTMAGANERFQASTPQSARKERSSVRKQVSDSVRDEVLHEEDDVSSAEEFIQPPEAEYEQDEQEEREEQEEQEQKKAPQKRARGRPKGRKSGDRPAAQPPARSGNPRRDTESADPEGNKRRGPKSLVALRAGTPQEEEGATQTRSGRTSIKPLKYWCNETFIWRHGEVDGVVRAEELDEPRQPSRARGKSKKKKALGSIREDEEDEDEDLLPEAWEEELGVINGRVRTWNAELGMGDPDDEIHEDIAFASTSIATRDVQGSAFRYAKVMTLPFFGAGMVEVPPEGYKRMKNSRKMQMIFFVHEGKVTVEVGDIKFGMSKGGVWQVPRGNNYAILNESKRHTAKIFFAQGCEMEAGMDEAGPV